MTETADLLQEDEQVLWASGRLGKEPRQGNHVTVLWLVFLVFIILALLVLPTRFALPAYVLNANTGAIIILFLVVVFAFLNLNLGKSEPAKTDARFVRYCLTSKRLILADKSGDRQISIRPVSIIRIEVFLDKNFQSVTIQTGSGDDDVAILTRVEDAKELKRLILTHWPSSNGSAS